MSDDDFDLDAILNDALDDLDKAETKPPAKYSKPVKPIATHPAPSNEPILDSNRENFDPSSEDFKQHKEQLMKLRGDGSADCDNVPNTAEMEKILMSALSQPKPTQNGPNKGLDPNAPKSSSSPKTPVSSGDIIQNALNMMSKGRETMKQDEAIVGDDEELIAKLFKGLQDFDPENPNTFEDALNSMMDGLFTKDILQEPVKQVAKDYPGWLEANKKNLSPELLTRYTVQCETFKEIDKIMEQDDPDMGYIKKKIDGLMEDGELPVELRKKMFGDIDPAALFEGGAFDPKTLFGGDDPNDEDLSKLMGNCPVQ